MILAFIIAHFNIFSSEIVAEINRALISDLHKSDNRCCLSRAEIVDNTGHSESYLRMRTFPILIGKPHQGL